MVDIAPLVVSNCALIFTVGSFWWLNARRGRLRSWEPQSFAGYLGNDLVLLLSFPLVLHNTGAVPLVVLDLRLSFPSEPTHLLPIPWRATRTTLQPGGNDGHQLPAGFAVPGRAAEQRFIEFGCPFPGVALEAKDYKVRLEVYLGDKGWKRLLDFTLRLGTMQSPGSYVAYSNRALDISPEMRAKANQLIKELLETAKK